MTTYDINLPNFDKTKSYEKNNIVIYDNTFYVAINDIEANTDFNLSDWSIINDPDTVYNQKVFPDFLNLENNIKPPTKYIDVIVNNATAIVKGSNRLEEFRTADGGLTWTEYPLNYKNLSIYLLPDKRLYSVNDESARNLSNLNINDKLIEIVFSMNFSYPITDLSIIHELVFDKCKIIFSHMAAEDNIDLQIDEGTVFTLVDRNNKGVNVGDNDLFAWNPGTFTLEFSEEITLNGFKDGNGNTITTNNLPHVGAYIPFSETWILNEKILEISYDNKGNNYNVLDYAPSNLIKQICISDGDEEQTLIPDANKTIKLPFVDTGSSTAGILKPHSPDVNFVDGVAHVPDYTPTVYNAFDYGSKEILDPGWWDNHIELIGDNSTYVDFHNKKEYKRILDSATHKHRWEYVKDIEMEPGQCIFVDKMVVLNPEEGDSFVPNVTWFNRDNFTYLNSDPTFVQHRTEIRILDEVLPVQTEGVEAYYINIEPIDDLDNISKITIKGNYIYSAYSIDGTDIKESKENMSFKINSMHGEFTYKYDDLNVRRFLVGLTQNRIEPVDDDIELDGVNRKINQIYFITEPAGYVKSINTLPNYTPLYLPGDIYSTSFTKGIMMGVSPESGTGNVTVGWNFTPILAVEEGTGDIPTGGQEPKREVNIVGEIIVEYNY